MSLNAECRLHPNNSNLQQNNNQNENKKTTIEIE